MGPFCHGEGRQHLSPGFPCRQTRPSTAATRPLRREKLANQFLIGILVSTTRKRGIPPELSTRV